ncbi:MAG: YicC family protein [Candidatus Hydrogenedentota bacterium]
MTRSMTGFGKASGEYNGQTVTVEIASVNSRYLDCILRLPPAWLALDTLVKQTVRKHISRGKLTVNVNRKRGESGAKRIHFDGGVATQYLEAAKEIASMIGTYETLSLNVLAQLEGVLYQEEPEDDLIALEPILVEVVERALANLNEMRSNEGRALAADLRQRVETLRQGVAVIEARLPELNGLYEQRLRTRLSELKAEAGLTEERIAIETAIMAEKSDVTEEVVRLKQHLRHIDEILDSSEPAGRKLDFLLQEIHREVNTLGVKTRDANVAKDIVTLKAELEKMREQIQNVE